MRKLYILISCILLSVLFNHVALAARASSYLCNDERYFCINIQKGETWSTLFADNELRNMVMRVNRMNIELRPGMLIAIPYDIATTTVKDFSPFAQQIQPIGNKVVIFDPTKHAWGAYDVEGHLVKWGPAAGGKDFCPDVNSECYTSVGEFTIYQKRNEDCKSTKFPIPTGGAPMPYCMFFNGGYALHASKEVPGYNASHGCVRLLLEDARWLNQDFVESANKNKGILGTKVIVLPYKKPAEEGQEI